MGRIPKFQDKYSVSRVLDLKKRLFDVLSPIFLNKPIVDLETFTDLIGAQLPKVNLKALKDSISYLVEERLSQRQLENVCHLLAGNTHRLKRGKAVHPWKVQRFMEWVPSQVVRVVPELNKRQEKGATVYFKILAGTSATLTTSKWWSNRKIGYFSHLFGFTRSVPEHSNKKSFYPWTNQPVDFVSFRVYLLIDPEHSKAEPGFSEIHVPSSFLKWNREQIKYRFRVETEYTCPEGFPANFACRQCWRGYESCRAATHRYDFRYQECPKCKKPDAVFDLEVSDRFCIQCIKKDKPKI